MHRRFSQLSNRLANLHEPGDYFSGRRRSSEPTPDNILLFRRTLGSDLGPFEPGGDSFHERWVLLVVLSGRGILRIDRRPHALTAGKAMLIPPLHLHGYPRTDDRIHWLFITFEWPGHVGRSNEWRGLRDLVPAALAMTDELLTDYTDETRPSANILAARLLDLLRVLYPKSNDRPAAPGDPDLLTSIQRIASKSPAIPLPTLARRLGRSESHLRARFREKAGISLGRYLRESRLREAARLLREQGCPVKAAAEAAGYPDPFTFSRAFRRLLGVSPSQVRSGVGHR